MDKERIADEIADDLLYRTGRAITSGDLEWADGCFQLPQFMETVDGSQLIETEEGVRQVIRNVRAYYAANGVTDVVRTVISAEFVDPNTIGSTHVARLMKAGGKAFRAPYPVYSIIRKIGDDWKIVSTSYAILDAPDHNRALRARPSDTLSTQDERI